MMKLDYTVFLIFKKTQYIGISSPKNRHDPLSNLMPSAYFNEGEELTWRANKKTWRHKGLRDLKQRPTAVSFAGGDSSLVQLNDFFHQVKSDPGSLKAEDFMIKDEKRPLEQDPRESP
jgi:hypothetical protein